ncbi:hypothetical protein HZI73_17190 [Vallitalea pronyensis]|uniref:Uroporphyrinogen decarboxylase (URO-D) domain-containing protein n=1 Tax=Vallitalea pronyensis TaxID=1348613 RepID=A0A8J8MLV5_9FIRM|nr:uroporphyrinogen decarboxylase family protein [Vallitalea pronyensis]QUI23919.1 hypothetical protein HZI73_17190 [Vallitalea pronyensis]
MMCDGIKGMVPKDKMCAGARKLRNVYEGTPDAPFFQQEFGFYCLDRWKKEGLPTDKTLDEIFGYDESGCHTLNGLGWCTPEFMPMFEEKVLEDRGEHEVAQDFAGRHVLYFKGRREGFMPEYIDHPVKDMYSWEKNCKWRLNPKSKERYIDFDKQIIEAKEAAKTGKIISQRVVGGFMYLRSLIGPTDLLYKFYDAPDLIHECMEAWLTLADTVISKYQEHITLDELYIGEDICYNHGPLISPDMIQAFLFPYYQQLLTNTKKRQIDKKRHLFFNVDTDGNALPVIPLYQTLGMDVMNPFEVASGCDVVKIGKQYPELIMSGGIDKRVLAAGKEAIDRHLDYILPTMKKRGGYIPTCDHGVPEEVSLENYLYFRKRCLEYAY